jgi:hypothetical protein
MIASGFGFFPKYSTSNASVVARPLVNPEFWREVSLTTYSRTVGALVHDGMRSAWLDDEALAVKNLRSAFENSDPRYREPSCCVEARRTGEFPAEAALFARS